MNTIAHTDKEPSFPVAVRFPNSRTVRVIAWLGLAAAILVCVSLLNRLGPQTPDPNRTSAFGLLAQAAAAEEQMFQGPAIVYLENQIEVKPVSDANWAKARWLPLVALKPDGEFEFQQMTLSAAVGQGYTVKDQTWYDPATGHFSRVLWEAEQPVFAGSYDGKAVYRLQDGSGTGPKIERQPVTEGFQRPRQLARVLGMAAGLPTQLDEQDTTAAITVTRAGETRLDDDAPADILKVAYTSAETETSPPAHFLFTIRRSDKTIAAMEFRSDKESLFVVRRVKKEAVEQPGVTWDLAGIIKPSADKPVAPNVGFLRNLVKVDVSVKEMIETASFKTYVFSPPPAWTGKRTIVDILDVASPPKRMFAVCDVADDGRHVVLIQSPSYNNMLGKTTVLSKLVYTSPSGTKVWSSSRDRWLAGILLQSAQMAIRDAPADDRTGYLLETPEGTFPAVAVNGTITEEELHTLVDSLTPAQQTKE